MLKCQKDKFFLPQDCSYLNCGYLSPLMKTVEEKGIEGIKGKRYPYQIKPIDFFEPAEKLRRTYANLINCPDPRRVIIIPSVSFGIANVVNNINAVPGGNIVLASGQFPSNVYAWQRLAERNQLDLQLVSAPIENLERGRRWNQLLLEAIDKKTVLVSIGNIHWADGTLFNLKEIRNKTNKVGALMIIDGTQSIGALPFDVENIQPDAVFCAGYKWLMGPYSIGLGYMGTRFDEGKPVEENWINRAGSEDFTQLVNYRNDYHPGALRYEIGERSNFILLPMMQAALEQIIKWGPENIQHYCSELVQEHILEIKTQGHEIEDLPYRANHLFGIRFHDKSNPKEIKEKLNRNKVYVSFRGDALRVSVNVFNTETDLERLVSCLK